MNRGYLSSRDGMKNIEEYNIDISDEYDVNTLNLTKQGSLSSTEWMSETNITDRRYPSTRGGT